MHVPVSNLGIETDVQSVSSSSADSRQETAREDDHDCSGGVAVQPATPCSSASTCSQQFIHDPYNWQESSKRVSEDAACLSPRPESAVLSLSAKEAAAAAEAAVEEGRVHDKGPEPVLGSVPVLVGIGPSGKPCFRHTLYRITPSQRMGAWIRGNAVTNVLPDGPAVAAGLEAGMRVLEVEGEPADPATVSAVVRRCWKTAGLVTLLTESHPPGTKSKRSLAKAKARARTRLLSQQQAEEELELE